jgi:rubrerythrin
VGRLTESAENIAFSSNLRSTIQRIGNALDDEWQTAERERLARAEREHALNTCQHCGTPYATPEAVQCAVCGAPRIQGGQATPAAE